MFGSDGDKKSRILMALQISVPRKCLPSSSLVPPLAQTSCEIFGVYQACLPMRTREPYRFVWLLSAQPGRAGLSFAEDRFSLSGSVTSRFTRSGGQHVQVTDGILAGITGRERYGMWVYKISSSLEPKTWLYSSVHARVRALYSSRKFATPSVLSYQWSNSTVD